MPCVMFVLAELQDIVRIEPRSFSKDTGQEITDELNRKFANKVIDLKHHILLVPVALRYVASLVSHLSR